MFKRSTPFSQLTVNIEEAAEFLGFKDVDRFRRKVKSGEIPGAKIGREWVFFKEDLVKYLRDNYTTASLLDNGVSICQSAKRKIAPTTTPDSAIVALECKNLREQLRGRKRNGMKTNDDTISENSSHTEISRRRHG
jgi:excisionase family DNA binding protein